MFKNYLHITRQFLHSRTARLASTYLAIIMLMSIGFSGLLYHTSSHELERQIPSDSYINNLQMPTNIDLSAPQAPSSIGSFFHQRVREGRADLFWRLILINVITLFAGAVISYYLSRRTLKPIEQAIEAQAQFVSDASHELRTPLAAIQTTNEVALRRQKLTIKEAKEIIESNTEDVLRLKSLSDGLLNLASGTKVEPHLSSVPLQEVVSEALNMIVAPASIKDITIDDKVPNIGILSERHSLAQVLIILLDNAIKYSPKGKTVTVSADVRNRQVYLTVADKGMGIQASDLPHLFQRFYRADTARSNTDQPGYGLGLAIAQQIIHSQHGKILVSTTLGKGSVFTIKLPSIRL